MPMNSVNTNVGALVALQNLNQTSAELMTVQNRINSGKRVASAKDNGAIWAIAQGQRGQSQALNAVKESLQRGQSAVDVAISAGESVSDLLLQMKEKALAASDTSLDSTSRSQLNDDYKSLRDQITKVVNTADFNGANMIKASGTTIQALGSADGAAASKVTVAAQDLSLAGISLTATSFATATVAAAQLALVNTAIAGVSTKLAKLGTGSKALELQFTFVGKLQDAFDTGVGNLVDADLAKESARLQALQTKQQLGIQALAIANSSSSNLLGLFR